MKICGVKYKVRRKKMKGLEGLCDLRKKIIYLHPKAGPEVLAHEIAHAVWYESGWGEVSAIFLRKKTREQVEESWLQVFLPPFLRATRSLRM